MLSNAAWQRMLYLLVISVVFEGVVRKLVSEAPSQALFFAKDGLCLILLGMLAYEGFPRFLSMLLRPWLVMAILFLPVLLATFLIDPLLAAFGTKQYLLFPVVATAVIRAFPLGQIEAFRRFACFLALLIIPTGMVAMIQLGLPAGHWLNQGVGGSDLSGFTAGGRLRVSSTFPFVAQFAMFLNALFFGLGLRFAMGLPEKRKKWMNFPVTLLIGFYILAVFATGSRSSVIGAGLMYVLASLFIVLGNRPKAALKLLTLSVICLGCYFTAQWLMPHAFVAYEHRSAGGLEQEIEGRFQHAFINWNKGLRGAPPTWLGYGIGVMSNGSDVISQYSRSWREKRVWGEADLPNTMFEGGYWLVFAWMGFRLYIIVLCLRLLFRLKASKLYLGAACAMAYIVVTGLTGTLGIQPPMAIWFWMAVGIVITIYRIEQQSRHNQKIEKTGDISEQTAKAI